jgi:predicted nucleic acid-binding protein
MRIRHRLQEDTSLVSAVRICGRQRLARSAGSSTTSASQFMHSRMSPFLAGLHLYEQRRDKDYSLVDCISMTTTRREEISEVLTNDRHFTQEGFEVVLR